jgi:tryptophanyl-tRNA synthetase
VHSLQLQGAGSLAWLRLGGWGKNRRMRALSGIKPTGMPHLGNYLGMIRPAIALQETHEAFYFIADYHALTTGRDAAALRRHSSEVAATFLALGLDPKRATLYRQSDVPEVQELSWILSCVTNMGFLERAHAYKAAVDCNEANLLPVGTFTYPVLMAADILLVEGDVVPVGKDQVQHVEMAQDMAQRLNAAFGEGTLKRPEPLVRADVQTVIGTDGRKMSKSYDNTIPLFLASKPLEKLVKAIKTDSLPVEAPKDPDTNSVFALYRLFATPEETEAMAERFRAGGMGYGHAKGALFEVLERELGPARARFEALVSDEATLEKVLAEGAARVRAAASPVLARVRRAVGLPVR